MMKFSFLPFLPYDCCSSILESYGKLMAKNLDIFPEKLWITEHPEVYTFGHRSDPKDSQYIHHFFPHVPCIKTSRGGKVTFHGPGQIMIYPSISLKNRGLSPGDYIKCLELWIQKSLEDLKCITFRHSLYPGLWIKTHNNEEKKIMSLGLRISQGIAFYGLALNVAVDLRYFHCLSPCGLPRGSITSLQKEGFNFSWDILEKALLKNCPF